MAPIPLSQPPSSTTPHISHLTNPLATPEQLATSGSQLDGIPADLEDSLRHAGARLAQAAGILLRLPQDIIAQAIVTYTRFWVGAEGGSFAEYGAKDISAASLYLTAKLSAHPKSPRSVINVYAYLDSLPSTFALPAADPSAPNDPDAYYVSEGTYQTTRARLLRNESLILRALGFQTHVALPYTLVINYLQTLDAVNSNSNTSTSTTTTTTTSDKNTNALAKRALAHCTAALLSPQLLYLTHQPAALAVAAIYLAAREVGVKLAGDTWWEVFDVDREELGFLVVGLKSLEGWVRAERNRWGEGKVPVTVEGVREEVRRRGEGVQDGDGRV